MPHVSHYLLAAAAWAGGSVCCAAELPRIEHVGPVSPDILGITILAGRVEYGRQIPYAKQEGDVVADPAMHRFVMREGKAIGTLVGKDGEILCTMDEIVGEKLDAAWADRPASYSVTSPNDSRYDAPQQPKAVYRKSKPSDLGMIGPYQFDSPTENVIYLQLPAPLEVGKDYLISLNGGELPAQKLTFDPAALRSEAVHVNQIGFRPDDPAKVAFLSCWMGEVGGVKYGEGLPFAVLDDVTAEVVWEGTTTLSKAAADKSEDAYAKNYNGADVHEMDFTALANPGRYRVYVKGIGCSYPFEIGDDVWRRAFTVSARGLYHQRSGIALGEPYTTYSRPRCFHPDDGVQVFASQTPFMDTGNGLNQQDSNFGNLVKGKTEEIVANAWGGYMDAGDWDRRLQHLKSTLLLLELAELFPDYFASLALNIPESGNELPDVVNEALFNLDFYRRMQLPEGGVRGGIESSEHPRRGEASFQESLTVMAYAPDIFSSYVYAGVAARAARWLESRAPQRGPCTATARCEPCIGPRTTGNCAERECLMGKHPAVRDARNYAAAELFCLTGEAKWNAIFVTTTLFQSADAAVALNWDSLDQTDSAWVYARTDRPGMDEKTKRNCRDVLLREADERAGERCADGISLGETPLGPRHLWRASSPESCVNVVRCMP